MKSNQIEKIIADQKNAAKRLATALLAAATITTGAVALSSCDNTDRPTTKRPNNDTNEILSGELPSEQLTDELTTEEVTISEKEIKLINDLKEDYPEFENGVYGFNLIIGDLGLKSEYYLIKPICRNENGDMGQSLFAPIIISQSQFEEIIEKMGDNITILSEKHYSIVNENLPEELSNYIFTTFQNIYENELQSETMEQ